MSVSEIVYSLTAPVEAIMFFMMFEAFFERRGRAAWQFVIGWAVLALSIKVVNTIFLFRLGNAIGMILAAMVVSFYFYRTTWPKRIFVPIFTWVLVMGFMEILVLNFICLVFGITTAECMEIPLYLILGVVLSKSLGLAVCYAFRVRRWFSHFEMGQTYWLLFVVLFSSSVVAVFLILLLARAVDDESYNAMTTFCAIGLFASNFLALYLYERSSHQNQIIRIQEQAEQSMQAQLKYYDEVTRKQDQIRSLKHDMNSHLIALNSYLENGDVPGCQRYLASLTDKFHHTALTIDTGNNALDAILSEKQAQAESNNIAFNANIRIQKALTIDPQDLSIIFGNALNNAIEACARLSENEAKSIDLRLIQDAHSLYCKVSNTAPPRKDNHFRTSKADTVNHGFGLRNIRAALEKYDVTPEIKQEGNIFSIAFILYQ